MAETLATAFGDAEQLPGLACTMATAIKGTAALGSGDLHTAVECLRGAVTALKISHTTNGGCYLFGIGYTEALANTSDIDAALEALSEMQRNRHPARAYRESDSLLAAAWVAAALSRTSEARALAARAAEFARTHGQHAREVACLQAAIQFGDKRHATGSPNWRLWWRVPAPASSQAGPPCWPATTAMGYSRSPVIWKQWAIVSRRRMRPRRRRWPSSGTIGAARP